MCPCMNQLPDIIPSSRALDYSYIGQSSPRDPPAITVFDALFCLSNAAQERESFASVKIFLKIGTRGVCNKGKMVSGERYLYPVRRRSPRMIPFLTCLELRPMLISEHVKVS